jgi:hypothetical protein
MISEYTGCITVLKGPASIVSDGKKSFVNIHRVTGPGPLQATEIYFQVLSELL